MQFQLMSDVHLDFHHDYGDEFVNNLPIMAPTLVLAGDLCEGDVLGHALELFCKRWTRVVLVLGNHDHYRASRYQITETIRDVAVRYPNLTYLNRNSIVIDGVTLHGATLWFPYHEMNKNHSARFADFKYVPDFVPWVYEEHALCRQYLEENLKEGDVMITHHLPMWECIDPEYVGSPHNRFFVGDMMNLIIERRPSCVAYGHTHKARNTVFNNVTKLVCNPLGYPFEQNTRFNPGFVVEV